MENFIRPNSVTVSHIHLKLGTGLKTNIEKIEKRYYI